MDLYQRGDLLIKYFIFKVLVIIAGTLMRAMLPDSQFRSMAINKLKEAESKSEIWRVQFPEGTIHQEEK